MKIIVLNDRQQINQQAASIFADVINSKEHPVLGLATGSSPVGLYQELIKLNQEKKIDFSQVTTVNLDEYWGLEPTHPQSYRYFMNTNLFDHVNIDKAKTYVPNGLAENPQQACAQYDQLIESLGHTDIQLLGVGSNGHLAFNEPDDKLVSPTHITNLKQSTIEANSRFFDKIEDVPTQAITMGMGSILKSRKIVLIATGAAKAEAIRSLTNDYIDPQVPITLLKLHPDVTIFVDTEAAKYL